MTFVKKENGRCDRSRFCILAVSLRKKAKEQLKEARRQKSDKKEICFSYSDSERPPHWIPQDERPKEAKWGYAYIGEYINTDRVFVSIVLRRDLSWEDDAVKLVTNFDYIPPKEEKFDVQELKEFLEAYDETVRKEQDS